MAFAGIMKDDKERLELLKSKLLKGESNNLADDARSCFF